MKCVYTHDIGVIGAGRMGACIAGQMAINGARVAVFDKSEFDRKKGYEIMSADLKALVDSEMMLAVDRDDALSRITMVTSIVDAVKAPLVIEVIYEDLKAKQELFKKLDQACRDVGSRAVLASNSITFTIDEITGDGVVAPDRQVCGVRFLHPVFFMPPVEISSREDAPIPSRLTCVSDHLASYGLEPFYVKARKGGYWRRKLDQGEVVQYRDAQRKRTIAASEGGRAAGVVEPKPSAAFDDCSICLERVADSVLAPCGHDNMCLTCAVNIRARTQVCPTCRARIERVLKKS